MRTITKDEVDLIDSYIAEVSDRLDGAILEKDLLVTDVLSLLSNANFKDCQLVFCGGTCLSKSHKIIERMSEDIDFKVVVKEGLSKNAKSKALSQLKHDIIFLLEQNGFVVPADRVIARNSNSFVGIDIQYQSMYPSNNGLRSEIKLELTANPPSMQTTPKTIDTLVHELAGLTKQPFQMQSISIYETLAEKVISFLRRTAEFNAGRNRGEYDDRLVRHLYDVYSIIQKHPEVMDNLPVEHFLETVCFDAIQFQNQYPEFLIDPVGELRSVLDSLSTDPMHSNYYALFVDSLVYGEQVSFEDAVSVFKDIADKMISNDIDERLSIMRSNSLMPDCVVSLKNELDNQINDLYQKQQLAKITPKEAIMYNRACNLHNKICSIFSKEKELE